MSKLLCLLCSLFWVQLVFAETNGSDRVVHIGVLAKRGEHHTLQRWQPTAHYLSNHLPAYHFQITPLDFEEIYPAVEHGQVDFVLCNSLIYTELEVRYGVQRIVTLQNGYHNQVYDRFGGVIFTRADRAKLNHLTDLSDQRFTAVKKNSFGGYIMALREFIDHGIDPQRDFAKLSFAGTHDAVVYAVEQGEADAGTVRTDTLERMAEEGAIKLDQFKVIEPQKYSGFDLWVSTQLYPEWPLAKLQQTDGALADQVAAVLLSMSGDEAAAIAGNYQGWTVPGNYQVVRDVMRELRIGPFAELGEIRLHDLWQQYGYWMLAIAILGLLLLLSNLFVVRLYIGLHKRDQQLIESKNALEQSLQQLQALQQELVEEEKMAALGSVVAGVAHEVNTPLGIAISSVSLIDDQTRKLQQAWNEDAMSEELLDTYLDTVPNALVLSARSLERAAQLIRSFKQISVDLHSEEKRKLQLHAYITDVVNTLHNTIKHRPIEVRILGDEKLTLDLQAGPLSQVITNLLQNALLHAFREDQAGRIEIHIKEQGGELQIEFVDDGNGMTEEIRSHAFEPFFTTKRDSGGSGLGLHIVYNIITQQFGGSIKLVAAPGQGCRFVIRLPTA